jgi:phage baseplate assembly protein W
MATIQKTLSDFSDLNPLMTKNPVTGDLIRRTGVESVKASVRNLLLTYYYEIPFHPERGCGISKLLFENWNPVSAATLDKEIKLILDTYEPRVQMLGLEVFDKMDQNTIELVVYFKIKTTSENVTLNLLMDRTR